MNHNKNLARENPEALRPREKCGVFGIYGHPDAARLTYFGLYGHDALIVGVLCIVPSAIGQLIGQRVRDRISDVLLRRIVMVLLVGIALSLIARGF